MSSATSATDADAFLTALESKLRGPFSSVEVPKAIDNNKSALRLLATVLSRAQKVTQLRVLTGLLGVVTINDTNIDDTNGIDNDDSKRITTNDLRSIIQMAQQAPEYEEWVRVMAGIVQGVMFHDDDDNGQQQQQQGEEAQRVLQSTCQEIIERVRKVERETMIVDEDADFLLQQDDIDPTFAPYWQSLLNKPLKEENDGQYHHSHHHHHFVVYEAAEILQMDDTIEETKSKEEAVHDKGAAMRANSNNITVAKATKPGPADFPGFRSTTTAAAAAAANTKNKKPTVQRPKSSLFIPAKKPISSRPIARGGPKLTTTAAAGSATAATTTDAQKSLIHKRRPGAAQALLAKGRNNNKGSRVGATVGGGSRMKMIDVNESKEKLEEQQQQQQLLLNNTTGTIGGKKRSLPPPASPEAKKLKNTTTDEPSSEQQQQPSPQRKVEDWRKILSEHCNKITDHDRERVRQFFEERVNPTPNQVNCRIKLHEEQSVENGKTVKVTYYLNLDYTSFTSKQTKKKKEYK